jgi:ABC-type cobalamin transport system permease subunit
MQTEQTVVYGLMVAAFLTQLIMLSLQLRASRRHRHRSFLLLAIATAFGIAYILACVALDKWRPSGHLSIPLFYASALLLISQMVLGVWGTFELFASYRKLADSTNTGSDVPASGA